MTQLIHWRFDHPDHPTWYETPVHRLDETVYRLRQEHKISIRTNIIRNRDVPTNPNPNSSPSHSHATGGVRKSTKTRPPVPRKALAMRHVHEYLAELHLPILSLAAGYLATLLHRQINTF